MMLMRLEAGQFLVFWGTFTPKQWLVTVFKIIFCMSLGTFQYIRKLSFMVKIEKAEVLVTMKL